MNSYMNSGVSRFQMLKLYDASGAPSSAGNASPAGWAPELASGEPGQLAYKGTICVRLGPGKTRISVLFWLDNLLSALVGEYHKLTFAYLT